MSHFHCTNVYRFGLPDKDPKSSKRHAYSKSNWRVYDQCVNEAFKSLEGEKSWCWKPKLISMKQAGKNCKKICCCCCLANQSKQKLRLEKIAKISSEQKNATPRRSCIAKKGVSMFSLWSFFEQPEINTRKIQKMTPFSGENRNFLRSFCLWIPRNMSAFAGSFANVFDLEQQFCIANR